MSERKNIDRLFQEKFKDFEASPADDVWGNIEAKLEDKKQRRVIPLWWKLSGVAALLLIGLLVTKSVTNNANVPNTNIPNNTIVVGVESTNSIKNKTPDSTIEKGTMTTKVDSSQDIVTNNNSEAEGNQAQENKPTNIEYDNLSKRNSVKIKSIKSLKNKAIAKEREVSKSQSNDDQKGSSIALQNNQTPVSDDENRLTPSNDISNNGKETNTNFVPSKDINLESLKGKAVDAIVEKESEKTLKDTTKAAITQKNPLEELLVAQDEKPKQESKLNRWQITSNISPIFSGSLSNGSPIDSTLVNNSKSYNTNVGFGLGVSYAVNSKFTIRTGLNKLNMSYNTNDVFYYASMQTRYLDGLSPTGAGYTLQVESEIHSPSATLLPSENDLLAFEQVIVRKNKGSLYQEIGYLEMPWEMTYAVIEKRFGLKIISGFSTLFLQDNAVSIVSDNRTTVLGRANNLNKVHFSTNIGLGIKYGFMKSFEFNIEPTFKYQINTFSGDVGNFKPYVFGIYSGISYKF
ncbi:MAG: outer membrane beta-barrel protein [Flavobacterium sp.]|nr:outer membrane beta-barrel protein [Flavobacterium sp.]MBP8156811.1 outer membrane beta-barrel protein [Flavobacterium sp.]